MTQSATPGSARRQAAARRITLCAQRLTDERGLDGFTMEDLAVAAGVSRRTLFNYFPGKVDAVLGGIPDLDVDLLAQFRSGGPHGDLMTDLAVLADALLAGGEFDRTGVEIGRRVMRIPKLLAAAHERFECYSDRFVEEIRVREGSSFDPGRARILIRVLVALFDVALDDFLSDPEERPLHVLYARNLRTARTLFA